MIKHFVSDSNTDPTDSAERFAEAAAKLVEWNQKEGNFNTAGIRALEEAYRNGTTPGSGVILRYPIMHHLELISMFLSGESSWFFNSMSNWILWSQTSSDNPGFSMCLGNCISLCGIIRSAWLQYRPECLFCILQKVVLPRQDVISSAGQS